MSGKSSSSKTSETFKVTDNEIPQVLSNEVSEMSGTNEQIEIPNQPRDLFDLTNVSSDSELMLDVQSERMTALQDLIKVVKELVKELDNDLSSRDLTKDQVEVNV